VIFEETIVILFLIPQHQERANWSLIQINKSQKTLEEEEKEL
jgi:hypothetical protein